MSLAGPTNISSFKLCVKETCITILNWEELEDY